MPLGWQRLNEKRASPNKNIVFIKPRPGPDENTSKDFLERIAAQCLPVMNSHHLAVASLEEYEPNREFWGRNFSNGEVIQLVLKAPATGRWLPFKFVQMVMMHELAHNKQMNHSKAFWKVRDEFSAEMRALWARGYTGDGFFGRGILLDNGAFDQEELGDDELLPEHLCGGTFQSRGQKRKIKPKITYKERKERRIAKRFGTNGITLGADEEVKAKLEKKKKPAGKPRVAGSARGRELRAAAALARFEEVKKEEPGIKDEDLVTDSEAESDQDEFEEPARDDDAFDIDGSRLLDTKGRGMVKICEGEDVEEDNVKHELSELQDLGLSSIPRHPSKVTRLSKPSQSSKSVQSLKPTQASKPTQSSKPEQQSSKHPTEEDSKTGRPESRRLEAQDSTNPGDNKDGKVYPTQQQPQSKNCALRSCPICSAENETPALTCIVCSPVLQPQHVVGTWQCKSDICRDTAYLNAGDAGICGVCGGKKGSNNDDQG